MENSRYPKFTFTWLGAVTLVVGLFVGTMAVSLFSTFWKVVFKENLELKDWFLMLANSAGFLTAIAFFDFFIVRRTTKMKLNFNFSSVNFYTYLLVFPMMAGMMFISEFITAQIPTSGPFFGEFYDYFVQLMNQLTDDPVTMLIMTVIMASIFEEIIFRGIIQKGLINKGVKPWKAILYASVIFGIVHGNPWQFISAVMLGYVLGLVYYKTKSLLVPMLLHGFNNLTLSLLVIYGKNESFAKAFNVSEWVILAIGIVLFSLFYYLFMKKYKVHYAEI
ncbi:CPBP family intramembrane metalloprotease [Chryseobacterium arthrosphaerae]|uniref:CAAX protease n=1 Tax=Chryseobacterium arthrosphaerae TaxID=651561 RepID=A0A1B8ZNF7_9FLAO|nr:type II CAAX endopeptidase family protein [Chryseobacterium arthrosphaerae]AYZ11264.1 CPBP family intramembrane metalloprotease [Chryseobacterium arthrosphaerae]MDG4653221.1 type II CAAX endopeptidase family protein [Chryseobacterium arthrosphaerae]OCA73118.1 CAAX protease [Chryseobacterium arthrosphaerae]QUY56707.1 CPBP family intramembrane metalloprotease [Chryseobacterium arthrosphaerae]